MAAADLGREPPDAAFDHPKSAERFEVVRKDGRMLHRELLLTDGPEEVVVSEYPVKYVIGSGRHSLTYVVEAEGFLTESPVTWYPSKKSWGMSPGYDIKDHQGFQRLINDKCLHCHAGQIERLGSSPHRFDIKEAGISCERCHGPGALHVAHHASNKAADPRPNAVDFSIVNPARLSRDLAESICQVCHLSGAATILARARKLDDFRPGLPMQDFRRYYRLDTPANDMTVVGHVEQMHLSHCYQGDKTFSCLTCHDPHHEPAPKNRESYYKNICLQCHQAESCKVDPAVRHKQEPSNNCIHCHMPTAPTEISHIAFTHHRVGIHDPARKGVRENVPPQGPSKLAPILDLSALSDIDRTLSLGLAYFQFADRKPEPADRAAECRAQALDLLTKVRSAGMRDGTLDLALASLNAGLHRGNVIELARSAEASGSLTAAQHCDALFLLADALSRAGKPKEAIAKLRESAKLVRSARNMALLANCEGAVADPDFVASLEAVVRISPRIWQVHKYLSDYYRRKGNLARAEYHDKRNTLK